MGWGWIRADRGVGDPARPARRPRDALAGGPGAQGRQVAWKQLHVFATDRDHLTEHWAVRDDLSVIEAVDAANG